MNFDYQIAGNKYGKYCVPMSSGKTSPPAKKVLAGEVYEPKTIEFIIGNCKDGDVVHAGAYFGDFIPAIARYLDEGAYLWAYEPKEEHYICAEGTLVLNDIKNVALHQAGLGDENTTGVLTTVKEDGTTWGGGSRIEENVANSCETEEIYIVTIDSTVPSDRLVSIIHLDVEGFEIPALEGAMETIRRCLPIIIVETLPDKKWLKDNLFELGYAVDPRKLHRNCILRCK